MAKHKPSVGYHTHPWGRYPYGMVRTASTREIEVGICPAKGGGVYFLRMDRRLARMVAKRINQCLDDTQ